MTDRVATTGTVWLGLTARLLPVPHPQVRPDHAAASITSSSAFLNNADEPTIDVPSAEIAAAAGEAEKQIAGREAGLAKLFPADPLAGRATLAAGRAAQAYLEARFDAWLDVERPKAVTLDRRSSRRRRRATAAADRRADGSVFATGDQSKRDIYDLSFRTDLEGHHRHPPRGPARRPAAEPRAGPGQLRGAVRRLLPVRVRRSPTTASRPGSGWRRPTTPTATASRGTRHRRQPADRLVDQRRAGQAARRRLQPRRAARRRRRAATCRCCSSSTTPPGWAGSASR